MQLQTKRSQHGCGVYPGFESTSSPCQEQNITTASQWKAHYNNSSNNKHLHQCGFTTSEQSSFNGTEAFYQAIVAMSKIPTESFNEQNEIRIATWDTKADGYPGNMPIEAFFYIVKQNRIYTPIEKGLKGAQNDQQEYYNKTGIWIPIIRMALPILDSQDAYFSYAEADQKVKESTK